MLDSIIGMHRTKLKSKKWYHRIFYHLIDIMVVNSWLMYRKEERVDKLMKLSEFTARIANSLCSSAVKSVKCRGRKRGRPTTEESQPEPKRRNVCAPLPQEDLRVDGLYHVPRWCLKRGRCRRHGCRGTSRVVCGKCGVHLCFTPKQDCFSVFHQM